MLESHDQDFSFDQADLQLACVKYFYQTGLLHESNDNGRPRKRARLSIPDKAEGDVDIRSGLMLELNALLGLEGFTNLSDLSEIVM